MPRLTRGGLILVIVMIACVVAAVLVPGMDTPALLLLALILFGLAGGGIGDRMVDAAFCAFGSPGVERDRPGPRRKRLWRERPEVPESPEVDDEPWRRERERRAQRAAGTTKS